MVKDGRPFCSSLVSLLVDLLRNLLFSHLLNLLLGLLPHLLSSLLVGLLFSLLGPGCRHDGRAEVGPLTGPRAVASVDSP